MTQSDVPEGWYPNPADSGVSERFWDGRSWTERTRSRSDEAGSAVAPQTADQDEEYVPPGWYPDPDTDGASARYWDGSDWTERTRASVRPTPGPKQSQADAAPVTVDFMADSTQPVAVVQPAQVAAQQVPAAGAYAAGTSQVGDAQANGIPPVSNGFGGNGFGGNGFGGSGFGGNGFTEKAAGGETAQAAESESAQAAESEDEEIPAGWYPDPDDGGLSARYWDGTDWTERTRSAVRPSPGGGTVPEQAVAQPAEDVEQPPAVEIEPQALAPEAHQEPVAEQASDEQPELNPDPESHSESESESESEPTVAEHDDAPEATDADADPADAEVDAGSESAEGDTVAPEAAVGVDDADEAEKADEVEGVSASDEAAPAEAAPADEPEPVQAESDRTPQDTPAHPTVDAAVPAGNERQGPGSLRAPLPTPHAGGLRALDRLRGLRRKDEPAVRSSTEAVWAPDAEAVVAYRQVEFNRLELLLGAVWEEAMSGDVNSVQAATRLIELRARLMGIDVGGSGDVAPLPMLVSRDERSRQR